MSNNTEGTIQVFGNSIPEINDALRQILERLDAQKGLRGRTEVHDRIGASAPTETGDVATTPLSISQSDLPATIYDDVRIDGTFGFETPPIAQQTVDALTNNVSSGGTNGTIADYTDLSIYANDAAAIRNDIYQLARSLKQVIDALRAYGFGI